MKPTEYLDEFERITNEMRELTAKKNADYAGKTDAFSNFRVVETIGLCPAEVGILTRMTDKMARASRLLSTEARVKESIDETLMDLAIYSIILMIYLRSKEKPFSKTLYSNDSAPIQPMRPSYEEAKRRSALFNSNPDNYTDPSQMSDAEVAARLAR